MTGDGRLRRLDDRLGAGPRLPPPWQAADGALVRLDAQLDRVVPVSLAAGLALAGLAVLGPDGNRWPAVVALAVALGGALPLQWVAMLSVGQRPDSASMPARQVSPDVPTRRPPLGGLLAATAVLCVAVAGLLLADAGTGWFGAPAALLVATGLFGLLSRMRLRGWQARSRRTALVRPGRYGTVRAGCYTRPDP